MNTHILQIAEQVKEMYEGGPWYGKSATQLLAEAGEVDVWEKPAGQHSIVELVWHMVNWKSFAINRLRHDKSIPLESFDADDWRPLDATDRQLWQQGVEAYHQKHNELVEVLQQQTDDLLGQQVPGRTYSFAVLLHGCLHHDIYHLGQLAYVQKLLRAAKMGS